MLRWGLLVLGLVGPSSALACGGLFCASPTLPVEQTGERIVFALDEDAGKVEVHVQVAYEGPADTFAWIVPMPEPPTVLLSTEAMFPLLDTLYGPRFQLNRNPCVVAESDAADSDINDTDGGAGFPGGGGSGGVDVLSEAAVGPYQTAVLRADSQELLLEWLRSRDYYVPDDVGAALAPYVAEGSWFVALRLQKDRDVGELAPIALTYAGTRAVVPITLTQVAAVPDMGLIIHVLGNGRAVPENYLHVTPNPFRIDWWNGGNNYQALVGEAADEAGGQAFATDYAGASDATWGRLYQTWWFDERALRATTTKEGFVREVFRLRFLYDDRLIPLLERHVGDVTPWLPQPGDTGTDTDTDTDVDTDADTDTDTDVEPPFDPSAAVDELVATFVEPRRHADALFRRLPTLTRLSSSMSPEEMTQDPLFVLNPDMPEVPSLRTATITQTCETGDGEGWLEIDGLRVPVQDADGVLGGGRATYAWLGSVLPFAALRVERTFSDREPALIIDRTAMIEALSGVDGPRLSDDVGGSKKSTCGCQSSALPGTAAGLFLGALVVLRRRVRPAR